MNKQGKLCRLPWPHVYDSYSHIYQACADSFFHLEDFQKLNFTWLNWTRSVCCLLHCPPWTWVDFFILWSLPLLPWWGFKILKKNKNKLKVDRLCLFSFALWIPIRPINHVRPQGALLPVICKHTSQWGLPHLSHKISLFCSDRSRLQSETYSSYCWKEKQNPGAEAGSLALLSRGTGTCQERREKGWLPHGRSCKETRSFVHLMWGPSVCIASR